MFVANYGELSNQKFVCIFETKLGERCFMTNGFVNFSVRVSHHFFVRKVAQKSTSQRQLLIQPRQQQTSMGIFF
jgi:hypothetical protein